MAGIERMEIVKNKFEYLVIDEACQCIEPSTLIPFEMGPKRVILVGDQKQLPATTFSENSEKTKYSRSFFERLLDNGYTRYMLNIQYRMHPMIRKYPSNTFYEGRIQDDPSII
jgi:senataxin